jgi:pyruvate formate-lyase/glycerol dehydratase family glycyl radical enzyme
VTVETEKTTLSPKARIAALRERVQCIILHRVYVGRARLVTESYRETEGEPVVIRVAKGLNHVLLNMNIGITDGELIVGDYIEAPGESGCPVLIEFGSEWLEDEMDGLPQRDGDKAFITDEDKETLRGLFPYWKGRTLKDKVFALMPEELRAKCFECFDVCGDNPMFQNMLGMGHIVVDYEKVITRGLEAITREASERLEELDISDPVQLTKTHFYRAVIIVGKAVTEFAARYAKLARTLERKETDSQRKAELRQIAETCKRVPGQPARTFHEALQSLWFVHLALQIEGFSWGIAPGRMDQYLFPYYRRDIEEGRLDREKAKELLLCFLIKLNTLRLLLSGPAGRWFTGWGIWQNINVGGVGRDGRDATNELSYLLVEADGELSMRQPETVIRVHRGMPRDFLIKALEVAKKCRGKLKFVGDDASIQKLLNQGFTLEDARDYTVVGCAELTVPGKSNMPPVAYLILPLCLELALNNGVGVLSGKQVGPRTGNPAEFKSIQDVIKAFLAQVGYFCKHAARYGCALVEAYAQVAPTPLQSSLVQGCLEKGVDITAGGTLNPQIWLNCYGAINVGDSLAAIKKCVFDEGKITMEELLDALHKNFEGKEEIQQALLEAPKFGNDDDYVDLLTRDVISAVCDLWQNQKFYGGRIQPSAQLMGGPAIVAIGKTVGASADGRKSGEPLADGGVSPSTGRNVRGAVATFNSVAKLDHARLKSGGEVLNMRFSPDTLKSDRAMQKLAGMVQTFFNLGGFHVQFNIVSTDMLRDAQKNPEKYLDLLVRVATYSAYFVELRSEVQNQIISRIELELGS